MASSTPHSGPEPVSGPVLPMDALYEILIRLPAKELCRLRAVCRPWRSLLSDPRFIAAHAARHPGPLIVAGHDASGQCRDEGDGILCDILDLTSWVVKRIRRSTGDEWVVSVHPEFACVAKGSTGSCQLLNLATGSLFPLPEGLSEEHAPREHELLDFRAEVVLGQVASTGEYKLLRLIDIAFYYPQEKLCEVLTLEGGANAWWRGKKANPEPVCTLPNSRAVVDGIMYFFFDEDIASQLVGPRGIASFDLLTEEWRVTLEGPVNNFVEGDLVAYGNLSLATLNGSLVVVNRVLDPPSDVDLWFLIDFERGLWVKQHSVEVNLSVPRDEFHPHPLLILNDGRIVFYVGHRGVLRICNPKTNTCTDVAELGPCVEVGLYSGSLLGSANCAT